MFMCVVNLKSVNKLDLTWKQSFLIPGFNFQSIGCDLAPLKYLRRWKSLSKMTSASTDFSGGGTKTVGMFRYFLVLCRFVNYHFIQVVEQLMECQRTAGMPALHHFILDLEERTNLAQIFCRMQNILFCVLRRKHFVFDVLGLDISPLYVMLIRIKDGPRQESWSVI